MGKKITNRRAHDLAVFITESAKDLEAAIQRGDELVNELHDVGFENVDIIVHGGFKDEKSGKVVGGFTVEASAYHHVNDVRRYIYEDDEDFPSEEATPVSDEPAINVIELRG